MFEAKGIAVREQFIPTTTEILSSCTLRACSIERNSYGSFCSLGVAQSPFISADPLCKFPEKSRNIGSDLDIAPIKIFGIDKIRFSNFKTNLRVPPFRLESCRNVISKEKKTTHRSRAFHSRKYLKMSKHIGGTIIGLSRTRSDPQFRVSKEAAFFLLSNQTFR